MAISLNASIRAVDLARQLSNQPDDTAGVIEELANIFADEGDAEAFSERVAEDFEGSSAVAGCAIGLLRAIADKLEGQPW